MKLNLNTFLFGIIILLIALLGIEKWINKNRKPIVEKYTEYITDTTYTRKYFELKELYDKKTPPKEVIKWLKPDPLPAKEVTIEKVPDSIILYIGGLKQRLAISDDYIKQFPKNNKLITFDLSKEQLDITSMNTDGAIATQKYPLYLDSYTYQYIDNNLTNSEYKKPKVRKKLDLTQLYVNGGYDYYNKYGQVGLEYSLILGRFKISANPSMKLEDHPEQFTMNFKGGFRLLK